MKSKWQLEKQAQIRLSMERPDSPTDFCNNIAIQHSCSMMQIQYSYTDESVDSGKGVKLELTGDARNKLIELPWNEFGNSVAPSNEESKKRINDIRHELHNALKNNSSRNDDIRDLFFELLHAMFDNIQFDTPCADEEEFERNRTYIISPSNSISGHREVKISF